MGRQTRRRTARSRSPAPKEEEPPAEEPEVVLAPKRSNVTSRRPRRGELTPASGRVSRTPKRARARKKGTLSPVLECPTAEARELAAQSAEETESEEEEEQPQRPPRAVADGTRWEPTAFWFKVAALACAAALFLLPTDSSTPGVQSLWNAMGSR